MVNNLKATLRPARHMLIKSKVLTTKAFSFFLFSLKEQLTVEDQLYPLNSQSMVTSHLSGSFHQNILLVNQIIPKLKESQKSSKTPTNQKSQ